MQKSNQVTSVKTIDYGYVKSLSSIKQCEHWQKLSDSTLSELWKLAKVLQQLPNCISSKKKRVNLSENSEFCGI